jgi:xylene monooxygenase subunit XylM
MFSSVKILTSFSNQPIAYGIKQAVLVSVNKIDDDGMISDRPIHSFGLNCLLSFGWRDEMDALRYYLVPMVTLAAIAGFVLGGPFVWLGIGTFPVLMLLDIALPSDRKMRVRGISAAADFAIYLHFPLMIALYLAFAYSVESGSNLIWGAPSSSWQLAGSIASLAWLSSVPTLPVAHELMHRRHWFPRALAKGLSAFYGDPNRDIAHIVTHHVHLDTQKDSDTPPRGQTIYSFVLSATWGSYRDTWEKQGEMLSRMGYSTWSWRNAMWLLPILLGTIVGGATLLAGPVAGIATAVAIFLAKMLIEGFNYFQHYGLIRIEGEPIAKHHAWNHLGMISRPIGVEITNHINHHLDGHTPFYELRPECDAPQMPSLFLCFLCGLVPPIWHRFIAQPRLKDWDTRFASPGERKLADAANAQAGWPQWLATA